MFAKMPLFLMAIALLAGCQNSEDASPQQASSEQSQPIKTSGHFACNGTPPGKGNLITANADVAPGASTVIKLNVPTSQRTLFFAHSAWVRCQVDLQWCHGASCGGNPPVDFYGDHGSGLTWEAIANGDVQTATFTAVAHNADTEPHTVRLVLEMPNNWLPSPPDGTTGK